jgi:rhamnosyltransferase subunit B
MKVVLTAIGSAGDVFPMLGLGGRLRERGHQVVLLTNDHFAAQARAIGIDFVAVGTDEQYRQALENPGLFDPRKGFATVMSYVGQLWPALYDAVSAQLEPGHTIVLGHSLDFASRVLQEQRGVPFMNVLYSPSLLRSLHDTPTFVAGQNPNVFPKLLKRLLFWYADAWVIDPAMAPPLNALRARAGLAPIRRPMAGWMHSPEGVLALFPDWFARPQPDWPPRVHQTGFPLFDRAEPVPPDVEAFLADGPPPIVFTPGTAVADPDAFLRAAVETCTALGRRGLLLTRFGATSDLPSGVHRAPFAPLTAILTRCAALVHHGGIGTTAAGLAGGVPQVIMPMSHDQPDNAQRVKNLGVGDWLLPKRFTSANLTPILERLLGSTQVAARCRDFAARCQAVDGLGQACDVVEATAARIGVAETRVSSAGG